MTVLAERHAVCELCLKPVVGTLCGDSKQILLKKFCPTCQQRKGAIETPTLISSDPTYFLKSWLGKKPSLQPQGMSALIIEVTDNCNFECPTCIAGSKPGAGNTKRLSTIEKMIAAAELSSRKPDILMISGGEPTIHPKITDILKLACASSISHVILITNGKRIAEEIAFVKTLAALPKKIEIYLQFDSLESKVLADLRGKDYSEIRKNAVKHLCEYQIPTTLICVVKAGLNEDICGDVIRYALDFPNIVGVTYQPIRASGRTDSLTHRNQIIDLARVRNKLIQANVGFGKNDLVPHPMNPENICTGYLLRGQVGYKTVTKEVCKGNGRPSPLENCLYFLPKHDSSSLQYNSLFRVTIISFMDKYNFTREQLPYSVIGFVTPSGITVPLDTYYMFPRTK